jgi:TfoX/Sxy family transcriptional regulator of competence genes
MDRKTDKLVSAIGDIDTAYLEEALDFNRRKRTRFPKLSAACAAVLIILGVSVTAFAISRIPLSWRDIFSPGQTVIGDADEAPVISQQQPQAAATEELQIKIEKVISDERTLYLLYSVKANEGAVLGQNGKFTDFELYFPGKMMSGAYVSQFLERKEGIPENELEGVVYANWQPGDSANGLVMNLSNWQEKRWFDDVKVDFNVAEKVENAGENAKLSKLQTAYSPEYLWQPGDADVKLPGNASICNAGWEDGILQLVMKEPLSAQEWSATWENNWYFLDTRTDTVIYPEPHCHFGQPGDFGPEAADADWHYFWRDVTVDKESLPYLELHWGGKDIFTTVLPGQWRVTLEETPVSIKSEVLAENVPLTYGGKALTAQKIECSKLSMAVYFADYVDSTTGILGKFEVFDANGDTIPCRWSFIADQTDDSCMIWTRFDEPIEPKDICKLTFNGETVFER